jgi:hypothetical protein
MLKNPISSHFKPNQMKNINFSQNWAAKLDRPEFTTFRLLTDKSYQVGDKITFSMGKSPKNRHILGVGDIIIATPIHLHQVTEDMAWEDTGYSLVAFNQIITTMYKQKVFDWNKQLLVRYKIRVTGRFLPHKYQSSILFPPVD